MAKDVDRVCENYELKLRMGGLSGRADGNRELQLESYRQAALRSEETRKAVAEVLGNAGIYSIWWPYYYSFSRKLASLEKRVVSADVLRREARMQLEVWVARGLVRPVLQNIAASVFFLDLTGPMEPLAASPKPT